MTTPRVVTGAWFSMLATVRPDLREETWTGDIVTRIVLMTMMREMKKVPRTELMSGDPKRGSGK